MCALNFYSFTAFHNGHDAPPESDEEPDDTVIRSMEFGRCTICFEDIPYDPVGCLYCQQLIGCRRCVNRWYKGVRSQPFLLDNIILSNKQCPLCRHVWEDQIEVTSMFNLRND
ncbi:hypothetical protein DICVIV_10810 [Dictyocaulus viviparus]|uniref:RING-type domain-containing protein n=1 Tax=Dictyocaulus viviparus TaxID=29172 RepID=A0A0D8XEY4_DICVI|nr:hypothetical protein DICVIV_10810 [Dictyocaulus viviparus]